MIQPATLMTIIGIMVCPVHNSPLRVPFKFSIITIYVEGETLGSRSVALINSSAGLNNGLKTTLSGRVNPLGLYYSLIPFDKFGRKYCN